MNGQTQVVELNAPSMKARITIGANATKERLPLLTAGQVNFVLTDCNVYALHQDFFEEYFKNTEIYVLPAGEEYKTFQSLENILLAMTKAGLLRTSKLFAVGGGVVGDIGGLAASLYMRGIACVQVPTTLLAQVDSGVGGKTAVDLGGVKNIVGAFYQPQEVIVDSRFLSTLPAREIKCGMGEIVKYAALDGAFFDELSANTERLGSLEFLSGLIAESIRLKAGVVERDEKETGERKCLNVGHTTGHAIELSHGFSHGEGVLYGMLLETQIALLLGVCEKEYGEKLIKIVQSAIAVAPYQKPDFSSIAVDAEKAKADKKNTQSGLITLAVAKAKNEWTTVSLSFERYVRMLLEGIKALGL